MTERTLLAPTFASPVGAPILSGVTHLGTGDRMLDRALGGGLALHSMTLLVGPPFHGQDVLMRQILAHRLVERSPALVILTDASVRLWRREMVATDPIYRFAEAQGDVHLIDIYTKALGEMPSDEEYVQYLGAAHDLPALERALDRPVQTLGASGRCPLLVFDSLSTIVRYADAKQAFHLLRHLVGRAKHAGMTGIFELGAEEHTAAETQLLSRACDGIIQFREERHQNQLMVRGFHDARNRDWIDYEFTGRSFEVTGSIGAGRIL